MIGDRFGKYSKYIIQDRALPDVRDGLKPVQRRILYSMFVDGNTFSNPFRKSAKTVGYVIANYHPHGDSSVYEAMVRMSQWWKQSTPLIEMHGNNGSLDNDPPAAMRYTEARLAK
ncbi:MAG: DNA gyrase subunit A, partial [Bacilli bacterium]|nr:DNA gyrase subunit A [Bacilli bacterium]